MKAKDLEKALSLVRQKEILETAIAKLPTQHTRFQLTFKDNGGNTETYDIPITKAQILFALNDAHQEKLKELQKLGVTDA